MKQSETKTVKRSDIHFNPANIKVHSSEQVKMQKKNLRSVGYLGGIVYNETSHNLIDGHRRVQALDEINHYDGTPATDYEIKVEAVQFDDKTEKEQTAFMAAANTKVDYNLLSEYDFDYVDYKNMGLSDEEFKQIEALKVSEEDYEKIDSMPFMEEEFLPGAVKKETVNELPDAVSNEQYAKAIDEKPKMTAGEVKRAKRHCDDVNKKYMEQAENFVIINFADGEGKNNFCDLLGFENRPNMVIDGEEFLSRLDI